MTRPTKFLKVLNVLLGIAVLVLTGCQGYSNPPDLGPSAETPAEISPPVYAGAGQVIEFSYRGSGSP